ncbi:MAG: M56 family metallopeptidase [Bacteroidia bacterium]
MSIASVSETMIQALSWTLLHSLWQALILALAAGAIVLLTKKTNAALRYNLLTITFVLFIVGAIATFIIQFVPEHTQIETTGTTIVPINEIGFTIQVVDLAKQSSVMYQAISFMNTNAIWIVLIWLVIVAYKFIRLSAGLYQLNQLKKTQLNFPSKYWTDRIATLCQQLQINKKVQLLQSELVSIPLVMGYFKPVILVPAAMFTTMPLDQLEAVLIHELGHIRRNDFLVNMLQNITETIFFFNPALLWVSSVIKTERENCCDDLVITLTGNKQNYIHALLSFADFDQPVNKQLATAFTGEKNHLLNRTKRIIFNQNQTLNNMEKKFLSAGVVLASMGLFAFISIKAQDQKKETQLQSDRAYTSQFTTTTTATDTLRTKKNSSQTGSAGRIQTTFNGKQYVIVTKNDQIAELYVDGQKIQEDKIADYKTVTDQILKQAALDHEQAMLDQDQAMKDQQQAMLDQERAMQDQKQAMLDQEQAMQDQKQAMLDQEQAMKDQAQAMKDQEQAMRDQEQAMKDEAESELLMNNLTEDLIREHVIKNKAELRSFELNATEFIVNGVKQPDALHKKFKAKYTKDGASIMHKSN